MWIFELAAATCARLRGEFEIADEHGAAAAQIGETLGIGDAMPAIGAAAFLNAYHRGEASKSCEPYSMTSPILSLRWLPGGSPQGSGTPTMVYLDGARLALARGMDALPDEPKRKYGWRVCA